MGSVSVTDRPRVAFDVGALQGHRTGIGVAVQGLRDGLVSGDRIDLEPYVLSFRAKHLGDIRRLPFPATFAHRAWRRRTPPIDRLLGRPDVVHGTNYVVPPVRCPRIVSVYDCSILDQPSRAHDGAQVTGDTLRRAVDDGAHVLTSSAATTQRVAELLATDQITTLHLGPPAPPSSDAAWPEQLDAHRDHPFVLSLGTTEQRKNLPTLVEAFGRLAAEHATARLVIAGAPGNDQPAIDAAISRLAPHARERVVVVGAVDDVAKGRLLRNASILAYVSNDEGFGFPLLEAQQVGLPIVASTAGSIPEVAGAAALFSSPDDTDAIAANLHLALTSETVRSKLAAQSTRNLERFSWADTVQRLTDLYLSLANGAR